MLRLRMEVIIKDRCKLGSFFRCDKYKLLHWRGGDETVLGYRKSLVWVEHNFIGHWRLMY